MNLKDIGERVKELRNKKVFLSQEDFSIKLGYDRAYISRVEAGKQNITLETFIKIVEGLEVTMKDFFDFEV